MNDNAARERFIQVCRFLNEAGARYVVVGGFGCLAHGLLRTTKDLDILIPKDLANAERVQSALSRLMLGIAAEHEPSEFISKPVTIIGDIPRVDVLTVAAAVKFDEAWKSHIERSLDGVPIPFAGIDVLIASKLTDRDQDRSDVAQLRLIRDRLGSKPAPAPDQGLPPTGA